MSAKPPVGALEGIRVLDFSRVFAGPDSTQILGDFGADIIKVEEPTRGDDARYFGATQAELEGFGGVSPSFLAFNRNKRSITLDLGGEAGRAVARRLAGEVDVVLNNFRPGAMAKWGLGYADLKTVNPRLVYATFYAYGAEGPLADFGANDLALQAHSGLMSITGDADRPPVRSGTAAIDLHASLGLVSAITMALFHRERSGEGQEVDTSLLMSSAHLMNYFYTDYWISGNTHGRMGTANHLSVPNQAFPASDGMVIIIAPNDEMWRRCARALDAEALERPEFACASDRLTRRVEVVAALGAVTSKLSCAEIMARLGAVKVNVAKVHDIGEAANHPQLQAVGGVVGYPRRGKQVKAVASPFRMASTPATIRRSAPELGEHTDEVLAEFSLTQDEIAAYRRDGAFGPLKAAAE
jgi:crotonobetainyl-CoA:carnitine CoA-transferase CaiB-like acyl-CoA transferase